MTNIFIKQIKELKKRNQYRICFVLHWRIPVYMYI